MDETCSNCHGPYEYDISIPSPLWNKVIRPEGHETGNEYLCGSCIIKQFAIAGVSFQGELYGDNVSLPGALARRISIQFDMIAIEDTYGSLDAKIREVKEAVENRNLDCHKLRDKLRGLLAATDESGGTP